MKTPEIWKECIRCRGAGCIKWSEMGQQHRVTCWACEGSALPGYRAILYTPEQWEAAGGVLHDDLPMYYAGGLYGWTLTSYWDVRNSNEKLIVATPAITMKGLDEIKNDCITQCG